jgi:hypothetical protein
MVFPSAAQVCLDFLYPPEIGSSFFPAGAGVYLTRMRCRRQ